MTMRRKLIIGGSIAALVAFGVKIAFFSDHSSITGEVGESDMEAKATVKIARKNGELQIDLHNFPSFESKFEAPRITRRKDGSIQVSLRSYATGPFYRKSEQLTNLSFVLPGQTAPSGTTLAFHSGDYDQVFISARAP
jgi:hypothetical protein